MLFAAGDTRYEAPRYHRWTFDDYLATEQTMVLATYVVDTELVGEGGVAALTVVDEEFGDVVASS